VDAGKSTLVSVLTKGIADDGNGGARVRVLNYLH
jgi:GTPase